MDNKVFIKIPKFLPFNLDPYLTSPSLFSLIVLFQGCFGGSAVTQTPKRLTDALLKYPISPFIRFMFLLAIAYTATSQLETAIIFTCIYILFLQLIRTKEEREKVPYII